MHTYHTGNDAIYWYNINNRNGFCWDVSMASNVTGSGLWSYKCETSHANQAFAFVPQIMPVSSPNLEQSTLRIKESLRAMYPAGSRLADNLQSNYYTIRPYMAPYMCVRICNAKKTDCSFFPFAIYPCGDYYDGGEEDQIFLVTSSSGVGMN